MSQDGPVCRACVQQNASVFPMFLGKFRVEEQTFIIMEDEVLSLTIAAENEAVIECAANIAVIGLQASNLKAFDNLK